MRRCWLLVGSLGLLVVLLLRFSPHMTPAPAQEAVRESPRFTGNSLPVSPRQHDAWTPPTTTLPSEFTSATQTLFAQGLADPRGCEYRLIEIATGNCWNGDGGVIKVHGWVLPALPGASARFAVGWNGLVYPAVSVGAPADLNADILALLAADATFRAEYNRKHPDFPFRRGNNAESEGSSLSETTLLPLKACLLLRLGEVELAQRCWTAVMAGMPENTHDNNAVRKDPYLRLASDWAWSLFDRAVCAHMRGDDRLALPSARALAPMREAIEAEAAKRHFVRPYLEENNQRILNAPYLTFLKPLPELLADQERRMWKGHFAPFSLSMITREPDASKRIAGLIRALEEESARQDGQPGGVTMAFDPIVDALVKEGGCAVEPLLVCLESDTRLTRSVGFGRSFNTDRYLLPVRQAAYVALAGILQTDEFAPTYRHQETPQQTAARIRAFWEKNKDLTMEERWYRTLQNEAATPEEWFSAAGKIVQPVNESDVPGSMGHMTMTAPASPQQAIPLRGESLRAKKNPSVSELLAQRIVQLATTRQGNGGEAFHQRDVCNMALQFAKWDLSASLPVMRAQIEQCRHTADYDGLLSAAIGKMTLEQMRGGDEQAIPDYLAWVNSDKCKLFDPRINAGPAFEPFWRYPHDPALATGAEQLFGNPRAAWGKISVQANELFPACSIIDSPLLGVAAFRARLLRVLADTETEGAVSVRIDGKTYELSIVGGSRSYNEMPPGDARIIQPGKTETIRLCDYYAEELGKVEGMPDFQLSWSQPYRDAAIAAQVATLQKYGERYAYDVTLRSYLGQSDRDPWVLDPYYSGFFSTAKGRMSFPRRTQPATAREVEEGTAIFALPTDANTRIVSLPALPLPANWTTLKTYPRKSSVRNEKTGKYEEQITYDQQVTVWQAEEMLVGGTWQRFYGILGKHGLARVPAAEIEFTVGGSWRWGNLPDGFACQFRLPEGRSFVAGKPLIATLFLRNREGIDQPAPLVSNASGLIASRLTFLPHLFFTTDQPAQGFGGKPQAWKELPMRTEGNASLIALPSLAATPAIKLLSPLEEYPVTTFDLTRVFDLTKPGYYHVYLTFTQSPSARGVGNSNDEYFEVKADK